MDAFVVVALAVALVALGAVVVTALALKRAVSGLADAGRAASERIGPLTEELADEQAVTALEIAALQRTMAAKRTAPRRR